MYVVEWFEGANGYYWRVRSTRNGQTLLTSESYVSAWSAKRTARKIAAGLGVPVKRA